MRYCTHWGSASPSQQTNRDRTGEERPLHAAKRGWSGWHHIERSEEILASFVFYADGLCCLAHPF